MTTTLDTPTRSRSLLVAGAGAGAGAQLAVTAVYAVVRIGFHVARNHLVPAGGTGLPVAESADRVFGVEIIGGLLSLGPATLAGALLGALLGLVLRRTWSRQGPISAGVTGTALALVAALVVNTMVIGRTRAVPLRYSEWAPLLGYPSVLLVVVFGALGVWLYLSDPEERRRPSPESEAQVSESLPV